MAETRTIHFEHYYATEDYLKERFRRFSRRLGFNATNAEDARAWRTELCGKVSELLGLPTMIPCSPEPVVTERVKLDGYERHRIEIRTEPGIVMPLYALIPGDLKDGERRPAILAPHGHGSGGKLSPAGRTDIPVIKDAIEHYNYAYGVQQKVGSSRILPSCSFVAPIAVDRTNSSNRGYPRRPATFTRRSGQVPTPERGPEGVLRASARQASDSASNPSPSLRSGKAHPSSHLTLHLDEDVDRRQTGCGR